MYNKWIILALLQVIWWYLPGQIPDRYPRVTIEASAITVGEVLEQIREQAGVNFTYNPRVIDTEKIIAYSIREGTVNEALVALSAEVDLAYQLVKDQIVLTLPPEVRRKSETYLTLSGYIQDQASGESLIGATASIPGTQRGAVTNAFGYYVLPVLRGNNVLNYSYIGYEKKELGLELIRDEQRNVALRPASIELPNIIVEMPSSALLDKKGLGHTELEPVALNNMPEFAGESGLIKGLQSLPGISMHSDGSAFFYARGGERDQNLIIVDDAPIYNPSHLFGFYSIVIPEFAKSIQVYKSDIPAGLGDRLSSIVSIRTKDGNLNKVTFSGAVNPLINRFSLEVPMIQQKGALFFAVRRSNFDWLYRRNSPNADLGFGDLNFKWNYKVNESNRLFLTVIASGDNFTNVDGGTNAGIRWGNLAGTLRWNHLFGPKLFSNTTLYTGNYAYRLFVEPNYWQSALGTLSLKSDFTHYAGPKLTSRFGLELQAYFIDPGGAAVDSSIAVLPEIRPNYTRKLVGYYQGSLQLGQRTQLKIGARLVNWANLGPATYYDFNDQYQVTDTIAAGTGVYNQFLDLAPRLSLEYQLDSTSEVKLSLGRYYQYLQLISNATSPFNSFEVWLPSGPNIRPQSADQLALNYTKVFRRANLSFSLAGYYKRLRNQIDYEPHATTLLNPLVDGELRFGEMRAYGLELMLKKDLGRLNGWVSYTWSRALRRTPALNEGREYPAFQDRPHDFSLLLNYRLSDRWLFSGYYTAYSGNTFSSPTGFFTFNDQTVPIYAEKHNDRLPTYRRLDVAFKFRLNKQSEQRFQHHLTFSIYNVLAHKNVIAVNFNKIPVEDRRPLVKTNLLSDVPLSPSQIDLIRFFPSLTYTFNL